MQTSTKTSDEIGSLVDTCAPEWAILGRRIETPAPYHEGVVVLSCKLGRGLFAARPFAAGESVMWFTGRIIDFATVFARGMAAAGNPLQVDADRYIDVELHGLYVNHSCEPNVGLRDSHRLVALRPIAVNEEICMDYSTEMLERCWTMACRCGTAQCRGKVLDFDLLPAAVQAERLRLGIVQPFIVRQLGAQQNLSAR
jgi:hypothetical protein